MRWTYTGARLSTLSAELGNCDAEARLVCGKVGELGPISVSALPHLERVANDGVLGGIDNADVGVSDVGDADLDLEVDLVASLVLLDVLEVVLELVALAEVEIAVLGDAVLPVGAPHEGLGVGRAIGLVEVDHVLAADGGSGFSRGTGGGGLDEAVGLDEGHEGREAEDGGRDHFVQGLGGQRVGCGEWGGREIPREVE